MKMKMIVCSLIFCGLMSQSVLAGFSTQTHQAPASVVIEAVTDPAGNATIRWSDGLAVKTAEHYIGHGKKGGFVREIQLDAAAKQVILGDLPKNGGRFNLQATGDLFLHLECGGNSETTMPTFKGVKLDCSHTDQQSGQLVGALEVINPKTGKTFTEELK